MSLGHSAGYSGGQAGPGETGMGHGLVAGLGWVGVVGVG